MSKSEASKEQIPRYGELGWNQGDVIPDPEELLKTVVGQRESQTDGRARQQWSWRIAGCAVGKSESDEFQEK